MNKRDSIEMFLLSAVEHHRQMIRIQPAIEALEGFRTHQEAKPPDIKTRIGRNIDKFRKECGWSKSELARIMEDSDKSLVLDHIKGRVKPCAERMKDYAELFSHKLQIQITVALLES